jgi:hypothetical protein
MSGTPEQESAGVKTVLSKKAIKPESKPAKKDAGTLFKLTKAGVTYVIPELTPTQCVIAGKLYDKAIPANREFIVNTGDKMFKINGQRPAFIMESQKISDSIQTAEIDGMNNAVILYSKNNSKNKVTLLSIHDSKTGKVLYFGLSVMAIINAISQLIYGDTLLENVKTAQSRYNRAGIRGGTYATKSDRI